MRMKRLIGNLFWESISTLAVCWHDNAATPIATVPANASGTGVNSKNSSTALKIEGLRDNIWY